MRITGSMRSSSDNHHPSQPIEFIVSHRLNTFASGVARFNDIMAEHLGVRVIGLFEEDLPLTGVPLLSFKVSEFSDVEREHLAELLDRTSWRSRVFVHDWAGTDVEERIVRAADVVYCGNHHVHAQVQKLNSRLEILWSPGLILDDRRFHPTAISVFTFGMAHKLRTEMFVRLRELLERSGLPWAVYVSSANHETAAIRDAQIVFEEVNALFPSGLFFLGNLSDVAVYNYLQDTTFFAAFFEGGVRANNGTVAAALEHGAVVITNLDEHSPPEYVHMRNLIDVRQCEELPSDPMVLKSIAVEAMATARQRRWPQLIDRLRAEQPQRARSSP
jgi:hypothetical protein